MWIQHAAFLYSCRSVWSQGNSIEVLTGYFKRDIPFSVLDFLLFLNELNEIFRGQILKHHHKYTKYNKYQNQNKIRNLAHKKHNITLAVLQLKSQFKYDHTKPIYKSKNIHAQSTIITQYVYCLITCNLKKNVHFIILWRLKLFLATRDEVVLCTDCTNPW